MIAEKIAYLANVLSIACADGELSRREEGIFGAVAANIGATQSDIDAARQRLLAGEYKLVPLKVTAERLRNIEDMVMIAMADGNLNTHETTPIERFTDGLGLTQQEMDSIVSRAQERLRSGEVSETAPRTIPRRDVTPVQAPQYHPNAPKPPPLPHAAPTNAVPVSRPPAAPRTPPPLPRASESGSHRVRPTKPVRTSKPARASQQAKARLAPVKTKWVERVAVPERKQELRPVEAEPDFVPPPAGIVVAIAVTASDAVQLALNEMGSASKTGEYQSAGTIWRYAVWPTGDIKLAARCALLAAELANRVVYIDGKISDWNDVFGFCRCALGRLASDGSDAYCFGCDDEFLNIWGCRQARMDWSESAEWFSLGAVDGDDAFSFDKNAIRERLQANLAGVADCPFLDMARMTMALENLPDRIKARGRWRFREAQPDSPNAQMRIVNENIQGCVFSYETLVDGVTPRDHYDAMRLISRATKAAGGKPIGPTSLRRSSGNW